MINGHIGYHSCSGKGACSQLEGYVGDWSSNHYYACKSAGNVSTSNIGHNSCNAHYACFNNGATIGDCLFYTYGLRWLCALIIAVTSSSMVPAINRRVVLVRLERTRSIPLQWNSFKVWSKCHFRQYQCRPGKSTNQLSTFLSQEGKSFASSLAVDGNANTFSHTNDSNSWWEVDLAGLYAIDAVSIVNRWCHSPSDPHGCLCRLSSVKSQLWQLAKLAND